MQKDFKIHEFMFYDVLKDYSDPPGGDLPEWRTRVLRRPVRRSSLEAYTREIRRLGGRSWLNVQMMGTNVGDAALQEGMQVLGTHLVGSSKLLDIICPNAEWAQRIAERWAGFAASLGFSGIQWETMGDYSGDCDIPGFLKASSPVLRRKRIAQTCKFVNAYGWDDSLTMHTGGKRNFISFPIWAAGGSAEDWGASQKMAKRIHGGVLMAPPNTMAYDNWLDIIIERWVWSHCHGNAFVAVGDQDRAQILDYMPMSLRMTKANMEKLKGTIFEPCARDVDDNPIEKAEATSTTTFVPDVPDGTTIPLPTPYVPETPTPQHVPADDFVRKHRCDSKLKESGKDGETNKEVFGEMKVQIEVPDDFDGDPRAFIEDNPDLVMGVMEKELGLCGTRFSHGHPTGAHRRLLAGPAAPLRRLKLVEVTIPFRAQTTGDADDIDFEKIKENLTSAFQAAGVPVKIAGVQGHASHEKPPPPSSGWSLLTTVLVVLVSVCGCCCLLCIALLVMWSGAKSTDQHADSNNDGTKALLENDDSDGGSFIRAISGDLPPAAGDDEDRELVMLGGADPIGSLDPVPEEQDAESARPESASAGSVRAESAGAEEVPMGFLAPEASVPAAAALPAVSDDAESVHEEDHAPSPKGENDHHSSSPEASHEAPADEGESEHHSSSPEAPGGVPAEQHEALVQNELNQADHDENVANLVDMGFSADQAKQALREHGGNRDAALEALLTSMG